MEVARVSHYRILDKLGAGGMGDVYVALDETLQREVALKSIRAERRLNPESRSRFLREARVLSQLEHPSICGIYDYVEGDEGVDYLVLERVEGQSLDRVTDLDRAAALRAALQIAEVLVAAHAAGVVHRDLKPDNVMLGPTGRVKVLDFGLAGPPLVDDPGAATVGRGDLAGSGTGSPRLTEAGRIMGTLHYMSPEQARGEPATPASDMFSFGLVLQELVTGTPARAFDTPMLELIDAVRHGRTHTSGISSKLGELVERLKDPSPSRRPTALETVERIRWMLDAPKRRRRRLAGAVLLVATLAGGAKYALDLRAANARTDEKKAWLEGLVSFLIEDFYGKLEPLGQTHLLRDAAEQVVAYYASVPDAERSDEERLRHSLALLQAGRVFADQGEHARAEAALREALRLAERVEDPISPEVTALSRRRRAEASSELGDVATATGRLSDAKELFVEARASAEAAVAARPDDGRARAALSHASYKIGEVLMAEGDLTAADDAFRDALAVAEVGPDDPTDSDWLLTLAWSEFYVGSVAYTRGDLDEALTRFQAYHDIARRLVEGEPENAKWQAELASTHTNLGGVWQAKGELGRATASFEQAVAIWRELVAHDPSNLDWLRELGVARSWLASAYEYGGYLLQALREYERELETWDGLLDRGAGVTDWEYLRALARYHVATLLESTGRPDEAREELATGLTAVRALCASEPSNAEWRRELASHQIALARALERAGDLRAARTHLDEALPALAGLCAEDPTNMDWLDLLAVGHLIDARVQVASDRPREVRGATTRAMQLVARASGANPNAPLIRADVRFLLGRAHELEGHSDDARAEWRHALEDLGELPQPTRDVKLLELRVRLLLALDRVQEARSLAERIAETGFAEATFVALLRDHGIETLPIADANVAGTPR